MSWRGERRVSGGIGETVLRLEPLDVLAIQELDRNVGMRFEPIKAHLPRQTIYLVFYTPQEAPAYPKA